MPAPANLVYTPATVRAVDARAIRGLGIPGYELMGRAAAATLTALRARWPAVADLLVLCGAGNNAGDGYVIARLARSAGLGTRVVALADPAALAGDAARARDDFLAAGGRIEAWPGALPPGGLVVDALFGTGLARPVAGEVRAAIEAVNAAGRPVVAVDVPSGLDAATGAVLGAAIRADLTVTFVGLKAGLFLGAGPDHAGRVLLDDLAIPAAAWADAGPVLRRYGSDDLAAALPPRRPTAHKGHFGHVLVVGGNTGMGGAVRLAGEAALRSGAGLVTVATRPANAPLVSLGRPELMAVGVDAPAGLDPALARATVVAIGPGLGQDDWARALFARVRAARRPLVVDADALNLLAAAPASAPDWILTPHPGEAARLLGTDTTSVQADRLAAVAALARRYGGVAVLKGRGTLVATAGGLPWLIDRGNPGMASGGMGDVLTGITAALLAQFPHDPCGAAATAASVHAAAGDAAAAAGPRGLIASDLLAALRPWLNPAP
jgi:NAD(P)H-hydrate epimerase